MKHVFILRLYEFIVVVCSFWFSLFCFVFVVVVVVVMGVAFFVCLFVVVVVFKGGGGTVSSFRFIGCPGQPKPMSVDLFLVALL